MIQRSYPRGRVEDVLVEFAVPSAHRIFPVKYIDTPLAAISSRSRFSSADGDFAVLYAALDFPTAFLEVIVRDRFVRRGKRELHYKEISHRAIVELGTPPSTRLMMLDLRQDGCVRLGASTDSTGARNHAAGRALGRVIYREHVDIDGFVLESRFTGSDTYVVFDRAIGKLRAGSAICLKDHEGLPSTLKRYKLSLVRLSN